jgi:hypothetical protein
VAPEGDGWKEGVGVYHVPPTVSELYVRAGVRRPAAHVAPLARLPVPAGPDGERRVAVRIWQEDDHWLARAFPAGAPETGPVVPLQPLAAPPADAPAELPDPVPLPTAEGLRSRKITI